MGRREKRRRKSSNDSVNNGNEKKREKCSESPGSGDLSKVLSQVNSVLYEYELDNQEENCNIFGRLFGDETDEQTMNEEGEVTKMATSDTNKQPSNADIMTCLSTISGKLNTIDERLNKQTDTLNSMKQKMSSFEKEITKIWNKMHDNEKKTDVRLNTVEESVEAADFNIQVMSEQVDKLERKNEEMKNEMLYLQSQSMRNNLVFKNIPEAQNSTGMEETEKIVREFMVEKMKLAQNLVDDIKFDRVHRMGQKRTGTSRHIVAKFTLFKERELVRKGSGALKDSGFAVFEQFPREISEKRQKLLPQMKAEKAKGNRAWISYDTLYVNGKPVKTPDSSSGGSGNNRR